MASWIDIGDRCALLIIVMAGLPGTGKSTLARLLSQRLSAVVLDKDSVRAALFSSSDIEYSDAQDDFVVGVMLQVAEYHLKKDVDRHIVLDGRTYSKKTQVDYLIRYSREKNHELRFIQCVCSDEVARGRIERDAISGNHLASNRSYTLYLRLRDSADPLEVPHLTVNTDEPVEVSVDKCIEYLGGIQTP